MIKNILAISTLALTLGACSSDQESTQQPVESKVEICTYSYDETESSFEWGAFKTSEKVKVSGTFNVIEVTSVSSEEPKEVIESLSFKMETASVESNDESRNKNISKFFFETINTSEITGSIESLSDDGKAVVLITMNGVEVPVETSYKLIDDLFVLKGIVDVSLWNAMSGIEALNEECSDVHMAEDGISKLWSHVELNFKTKLDVVCK